MAHGQGQPDVSTVPSFLRRPFKHGGEVSRVVGFVSGEVRPNFPKVGFSASSVKFPMTTLQPAQGVGEAIGQPERDGRRGPGIPLVASSWWA